MVLNIREKVSITCPTLACALNIVVFLQTKMFKELSKTIVAKDLLLLFT